MIAKPSPFTLAKMLPAAPAQLLLLGDQIETWAASFEAQGYQVTCRSSRDQHDFAQHPSATREGICQVNLSLPKSAAATFSAALVLDFSPQMHPLALFDQLADLLQESGVVLLIARTSGQTPPRQARWLDYAVVIAGRCGFVALSLDGAADAQPSVVTENGVLVRALRKVVSPRWRISHVRPEDFPHIATLFQEVFGHALSRELWEWKYAAGGGNAVMASHAGALVAHYGGMYRDVLLCGQPDWVFQICDVMVHPKERGVLTRQGPFLLTAATSAEIYGPLGFGFPTQRAMKVAEKMGLYTQVGQMAEVRWPPAKTRFRLRTRIRPLERSRASDQALVEPLWSAMAHDLRGSAVGVKDWAFLERRYFSHPHNHYEVLVVTARLTGKPLGVLVLRQLEGAACELLDVIAPLSRLPLMIDQARRMTGRWALPHLYCWITTRHSPLFVACGGQENALDLSIPASSWTRNPQSELFKDAWWLMSGDTDFR